MEKVEIFIAEMDYEAFVEDDKTIIAVIRGSNKEDTDEDENQLPRNPLALNGGNA